jgi:phosphatidylserine decarboxylase
MEASSIQIWDPHNQSFFEEKIYGEKGMKWLYTSKFIPTQLRKILTHPSLSQAVGVYYSSPLSASLIPKFVDQFKINKDDFEWQNFKSFNDFFIRKFKPGRRMFDLNSESLCAPAEGRVLAFDSSAPETFPIKGHLLDRSALLGRSSRWEPFFREGPALIFRLCPVDYHRFHYPCEGINLETYRLHGPLESVHPHALALQKNILFTNERSISILENPHFGKLAYIEVGALFVGSIIQTHQQSSFSKGDEKGYFLFGGSTVILLGEKNKWNPSWELIQKTKEGIESYIRLGQTINQ